MKIAELASLITGSFVEELYREDLAEAERVRAAGCPHCGGVLHQAHYPRKARGIAELPELERRESFCCAKCRRRSTPKSVRFLGRKVYLGLCVLGALILRGRGITVAKICGCMGMSAETLRNWTRWWIDRVQHSGWWQVARSHLMPALEEPNFISELFGRFLAHAEGVKAAFQKLLIFVSPITVPAEYPS